jgi:hypothetical protein
VAECARSSAPHPGLIGHPYVRRLSHRTLIAALLIAPLGIGTAVAAVTTRKGSVATARTEGVPHPQHVFLIVGENTSASEITPAHAPYLTGRLKPQSAWLTGYHSFKASSSLGEYIAMVSGQYNKCEANNDLPDRCQQKVGNLFSQLDASGRTWVDWEQSMTNACDPVDSGAAWAKNIYSAHHNPALYFSQIQGGKVDEAVAPKPECRTRDLPTGTTAPNDTRALDASLAKGRLANFNLIVPNDCADGHDVCGTSDHVRQFDDFVKSEVPKIRRSPAFRPGDVIAVTWDEGNDPPFDPANPLLVATGSTVKPGVYRARHDHYGLARTLEDAFGLPHLANAAKARPISEIWR